MVPPARLLPVALVLAAALGCAGSPTASPDDTRPARMEVGSCLRETTTRTMPPGLEGGARRAWEMSRTYEAVHCADEGAFAEITARGGKIEFMRNRPEGDGCPPDTDLAVRFKGAQFQLDEQIVCARHLRAPHPGDPGGGGGGALVGDCVFVGGGTLPGANAQVGEVPCAEEGWFGRVVALAPDLGACPPEALSRVEVNGPPAERVLCLAPGGGPMPGPGDCLVDGPNSSAALQPPRKGDCGEPGAQRFVGFPDEAGRCPGRARAYPTTGYDRRLCLG